MGKMSELIAGLRRSEPEYDPDAAFVAAMAEVPLPPEPVKLVGANVERTRDTVDKGVTLATERLAEIEAEISRLQGEAANTRIVIQAYKAALAELAKPVMPRAAGMSARPHVTNNVTIAAAEPITSAELIKRTASASGAVGVANRHA